MISKHHERVARLDLGRIRSLRYRLRSVGRVCGLRGKAVMVWLVAGEVFGGVRAEPAAGSAVRVRVRGLGGRGVWLRPGSSDRAALEFLFLGYHLPPAGLAGPVERVVVFGANIGLLAGDLAGRYPGARLLGVEADGDNAAVARRNLAYLGGRCSLVQAAVWYRDERLGLCWEADAWGREVTARPGDGGGVVVDGVDAGRLLAEFAGPAPVDYLLVNIESAWYEMLRHGEWTRNVRCIRIEIQDHYDEAVPLLEALGYQATLHRLDWGAFALGIRPQIPPPPAGPAGSRLARRQFPPRCSHASPGHLSQPLGSGRVRVPAHYGGYARGHDA